MFKALASFVQFLLDAIVVVLNSICAIFPPSPFQAFLETDNAFTNLLAQINYFLSLYEVGAILEAWLVAVAVFYALSVVARWIKAIE